MFGQILGLVVSALLGKVGADQETKKQNKIDADRFKWEQEHPVRTEQKVNFTEIRNNALAAGFNPLTALAAVGGAGSSTTSVFNSFGAMRKQAGRSIFSFLADVAPGIGAAYGNGPKMKMPAGTRGEAKVFGEVSRAMAGTRPANVPPYRRGASPFTNPNGPRRSLGGYDEYGFPSNRDLNVGGHRLRVSTETAPAEAFQFEYGDLAENIFGLGKLIHDVSWNAGYHGTGLVRQWWHKDDWKENFKINPTKAAPVENPANPTRWSPFFFNEKPVQ